MKKNVLLLLFCCVALSKVIAQPGHDPNPPVPLRDPVRSGQPLLNPPMPPIPPPGPGQVPPPGPGQMGRPPIPPQFEGIDPKDLPLPFRPDSTMPYWTDYNLPDLEIRMMDSITLFNTSKIPKGKPIVLFYFDPDCKHCKAFTAELMLKMDSLKDASLYWITPVNNFPLLRHFYEENHFERFSNIKVVGRDNKLAFMDFYNVKGLPSAVVYDKEKRFVRLFDGGPSITRIYEATRMMSPYPHTPVAPKKKK